MRYFASPGNRRSPYRPRLETLEERCVPSAGDLDLTFGSGGTLTTYFGSSGHNSENVAIYHNQGAAYEGKIVVSVALASVPGDFAVGRYNSDGSLDTGFGSGGLAFTDFNRLWDISTAVAIQADGKVLVGGSARLAQRPSVVTDFGLVRYNTNGTLDTTFGGKAKGKVTTDFGTWDESISSVFVLPDGRILAVGHCSNGMALARYTSSGALDNTFGSGGKAVLPLSGPSWGGGGNQWAALQADGKLVVLLSTPNNTDFSLARITANGALDTTFGSGGTVTTDLGKSQEAAFSVAIQADGKIVVGGRGDGFGANFEMARYNTDGSLDTDLTTGFGPLDSGTGRRAGFISTPIESSRVGHATDVAVQANGKIVAIGPDPADSSRWVVGRFFADGSADTDFHSPAVAGGATAVALQTDGKIVGVGSATDVNSVRLARYEGDPTTAPAALEQHLIDQPRGTAALPARRSRLLLAAAGKPEGEPGLAVSPGQPWFPGLALPGVVPVVRERLPRPLLDDIFAALFS